MRRILFSVLALAGCASSTEQATVTNADAVIAAERAFARHSIEIGTNWAFRTYSAPDGWVMREQGFAPTQGAYDTPDGGPGALFWWPAYAGISRSGDIGFTTGPFSGDPARTPVGHYFTMWVRQPDGNWRWIFDGGPPVSDFAQVAPDAPTVPTLPIAARGVGSAAAAVAQIGEIERAHTTTASLAPLLAADAFVSRAGLPRATGGASAAAAMVQPSGDVAFRTTRSHASSAGDMVFTLGDATWTTGSRAQNQHFARVWQYRPEGWRIVYDQIMPKVAPPPNTAPLIAAEQAFALAAAASGAQTLHRGLANAPVSQDQTRPNRRLGFVGMSRGGDFGFTSGQAATGQFFTVWRAQADGSWRWFFDGLTNVAAGAPIAADAPAPQLPFAGGGAGSPEAAVREVTALEQQNASVAALAPLLSPDARVARPGAAPALGPQAAHLFGQLPETARFRALRAEGSAEGDLAFTLGEITGAPGAGYYARIWQRRRAGWRIVFEQTFPAAP